MALNPCKECGAAISTKAASCPACGSPQNKPTSLLTWIIGGFFAVAVFSGVIGSARNASSENPSKPAPTPEQLAAAARADREVNIVLAGAKRLKDGMKKPETFELTSAVMIDGKTICYEYKARNSFNDVTREHFVMSDSVNSSDAGPWNKLCAGKQGTNYTHVRSVLN